MTKANRVNAALNGGLSFLQLREEVIEVLKDRLRYSLDSMEIEGHNECAERLILLFADLLNDDRKAAESDQ